MADQKKMVEAITSMDVDFAQWYTDVVKKADLVDYSSVKGCMIESAYSTNKKFREKLDIMLRLEK